MIISGSPVSVLLVSGSEKGSSFLCDLLDPSRFAPVISCDSAGEARRLLSSEPFDLVLINSPLSDASGVPLAAEVAENTSCGVILFVGSSVYEEVYPQMIPRGVMTVTKSSAKATILQAVHLCAATNARLRALESKALSLEEKMTEGRLVSRAKLLLMEQLRMSEAAAHRYIEKQAMDQCVKRREIAENIIRTYSN